MASETEGSPQDDNRNEPKFDEMTDNVSSKANEKATVSQDGMEGIKLLDDFTTLLSQDDARMIVDLLKLAVSGS